MSWAPFKIRPIDRSALVPFVLVLGLAGCEGEGSVQTGVSGNLQWLVGGALDAADPAVVTIEMNTATGSGGCTGEFIDRSVLLTAAHCVFDERGRIPDAAQYRIFMGPDLRSARDADWIPVQTKNVHPNPQYDPYSSANDVAVMVLDQAVDVVPLALNTEALAPDTVGAEVRLVGYGATSGVTGAGFGQRRTLTTTIRMLEPDVLLIGNTGEQACDGDSGGPALLDIEGVETIIGTDDYSDAAFDCTQGDYYQRIDRQMAFIAPFLATQPGGAGALPSDAGVPSPAAMPDAAVTPIGGAGPNPMSGATLSPPVDAGVTATPDAGAMPPSNVGAVSPPGVAPPAAGANAAATAGAAGSLPPIQTHPSPSSSGCSIEPVHTRSGSHFLAVWSTALLFVFIGRRSAMRRKTGTRTASFAMRA